MILSPKIFYNLSFCNSFECCYLNKFNKLSKKHYERRKTFRSDGINHRESAIQIAFLIFTYQSNIFLMIGLFEMVRVGGSSPT